EAHDTLLVLICGSGGASPASPFRSVRRFWADEGIHRPDISDIAASTGAVKGAASDDSDVIVSLTGFVSEISAARDSGMPTFGPIFRMGSTPVRSISVMTPWLVTAGLVAVPFASTARTASL